MDRDKQADARERLIESAREKDIAEQIAEAVRAERARIGNELYRILLEARYDAQEWNREIGPLIDELRGEL